MARKTTNLNEAGEADIVTEQAEQIDLHSGEQLSPPEGGEADVVTEQAEHLSPPEGTVRAALLTPTQEVNLRAGQLLVICSRPGFRRAGVEHQHVKIWDQGELTPEQIVELRREPLITVVEISAP